MSRARRNPIGKLLPGNTLVRVGAGVHVHILNPETGRQLCNSGFGRSGRNQQVFQSEATAATCYRCIKLAEMNEANGREPWAGP